jgi:branched-chain amino acid transport system substrate-binding protein
VLRLPGLAALCVFALAACGSSHSFKHKTPHAATTPHNANLLDIYSSLPRSGPSRDTSLMILRGMDLALRQVNWTEGSYQIKAFHLNGSTRGQVLRNAQQAALDPNAVVYIGELASSQTQLSLPILNQAGIMQLTPGSPYPGLTTKLPPVTAPGEADVYYPAHEQTLLRLIPDDLVQAAAAVEELKSLDCTRVAAAPFASPLDGVALVKAIGETAHSEGMSVFSQQPGNNTKDFPTYVEELRSAGVGCFAIAGRSTPASLELIKEIHAQLPSIPIMGTNQLCDQDWIDALRREDPAILEHLYCTSPIRPLSSYGQSGARFAAAYRARYKHAPAPNAYALLGYQAASLAIAAFSGLGAHRDNRVAVREAMPVGINPPDAPGEFTFLPNGDLASIAYGLYTVSTTDGELVYLRTLYPRNVR